MLGILLGLGASACWGVSDFLGGLQSRQSPQLGVMLCAALVGSAVLGLSVAAGGAPPPSAGHLLAGLGAGVTLTAGLLALYRGLAIGTMSIVAPIAATGAVVPVVVGIASGEHPSALRLAGAGVAILGVVLVARQQGGEERRGSLALSVVLALVAAVCLGGELAILREAARGGALWGAFVTVGTYLVLLTIGALVWVARRAPLAPARPALPWLLLLGLCFGGANAIYAAATRHGQLAAVSVAASLYPVGTVLLARTTLHERVSRVQEAGIVTAIAGIALIAAG